MSHHRSCSAGDWNWIYDSKNAHKVPRLLNVFHTLQAVNLQTTTAPSHSHGSTAAYHLASPSTFNGNADHPLPSNADHAPTFTLPPMVLPNIANVPQASHTTVASSHLQASTVAYPLVPSSAYHNANAPPASWPYPLGFNVNVHHPVATLPSNAIHASTFTLPTIVPPNIVNVPQAFNFHHQV